MTFYAVANGKNPGIYFNWDDCKKQVNGFSNAKYKKFKTLQEAEYFINCIDEKVDIPEYCIFTDGACSNNGKPNAKAGIGIYFGENDPRNVSRRVVGKQTNNVAELMAIIELFPIIENDIKEGKFISIVTDSEYAIKCVTYYGKKQGEFPNKELVTKIYELYGNLENVTFKHCKAHTNKTDYLSKGNFMADKLATNALV
jgi:ribonuclease HI